MTDQRSFVRLLSRCVLLHWFDRELLAAVAPEFDQPFDLLPAESVLPVYGSDQRVCLQPDYAARHHADPALIDAETTVLLHRTAINYHMQFLPNDHACEDACFHHLHELFLVLGKQNRLAELSLFIDALVQHPIQPQHHQRLELYRGYSAVRGQDYEQGSAMLAALVQQPNLETEMRFHALNALGQAFQLRTLYDQALVYYEQLADVAQELAMPIYQALSWLNQSMIYNELENYRRAYELAQASFALLHEHNEMGRAAYAQYAIGLNALYLGYFHQAQNALATAIQAFEQLNIPNGLAAAYWNYGFLHHLLNQLDASEAAYIKALALAQETNQVDIELDAQIYLGLLHHTQHNWEAAAYHYENARANVHRSQRNHRIGVIEFLRGRLCVAQGLISDAVAYFRASIASNEDLVDYVERDAVKIALLGTTRHAFEAIITLELEHNQVAEAFADVEQARSRALRDALLQTSPDVVSHVQQLSVSLAEVQAYLPENAAVIEYFTTGSQPRQDHFLQRLPAESQYLRPYFVAPSACFVFVITRTSVHVQQLAFDPNKIQPTVDDPQPTSLFLRPAMLQSLHRALIAPLLPFIRHCDLLYMVPHGALHYVPFMGLCDESGCFFSARFALASVPSSTILLRMGLPRAVYASQPSLCLGYNDPEQHLVLAQMETQIIAAQVGGIVWNDDQPKSQRLLAYNQPLHMLHIAGHAQYNASEPLNSYLVLGDDDRLSAYTIMTQLRLQVDCVTLSSCASMLGIVLGDDEVMGFQRAFLYAGSPSIVGAMWNVSDLVAVLVMQAFYQALPTSATLAHALQHAVHTVRTSTTAMIKAQLAVWHAEQLLGSTLHDQLVAELPATGCPFANPRDWAGFSLMGRA